MFQVHRPTIELGTMHIAASSYWAPDAFHRLQPAPRPPMSNRSDHWDTDPRLPQFHPGCCKLPDHDTSGTYGALASTIYFGVSTLATQHVTKLALTRMSPHWPTCFYGSCN